MRTVIVSLIATAGLVTAANAQPAADAAPAPPATEAAAPPPAADAAVPAPAAGPDEAPPVLPTTGAEGQIIDVINRVCKPLVKGGDLDALAGGLSYKKNRRDGSYTATLVEKPYTLTIWPQGSNKDVCRLTVNYAINGEKPIISGLNIFAFLHQPRLDPQRNDFVPGAEFKRITNSWEYFTDKDSTGLVFVQLKNLDGSPVNSKYDTAEVLYSERTF
jgi:hypothetical protein